GLMAAVTVQMGHCFRTTGKTGGRGEQTFAREVGERLQPLLEERGHSVRLIKAGERAKTGEVFIALHTDGVDNTSVRGASTGFPDDDGGRLAQAWKRAHQRAGFPSGFLSDNRTTDERKYYGFGDHQTHKFRFLAEHGFHSNDKDFEWMHNHFDACADAHVAAVSEVLGDPMTPRSEPAVPRTGPPQPVNVTPTTAAVELCELQDGTRLTFTADGNVFVEGDRSHLLDTMAGRPMNAPVIGAAMTDDERGYWLVGADGGIFGFGAPPIQPYVPLQREFLAGQRSVVAVKRSGPGLVLLSNLGERYFLQPIVPGQPIAGRRGARRGPA
ncbi:MAG: N-acetylmuramoyl-L-alanine amidase, partial [Acidimicrobiales bacterium]